MNTQRVKTRKPQADLSLVNTLLQDGVPFSFIRFSDGETEIIRNHFLELSKNGVHWSKGRSGHVYPDYDHKKFDPTTQGAIRDLILESARYSSTNFFKGIPSWHNKDPDATQMLIELNGGTEAGLTFADLFINSNYKAFLEKTLPLLIGRDGVTVVGNYRMNPELLAPHWSLQAIPDNAFENFEGNVASVLESLIELPRGGLILSSASSLSNVVGWKLHQTRPDLTFMDIGTALHPQMGMGGPVREYHTQLSDWTLNTVKSKVAYMVLGRSKLKW